MSTRYNTGNPIESTDVRDMSDNAKNLDLFSNSSELSFDDRFGVERKTIQGMIAEFDAQILNIGFSRIGTFTAGATLTNPRQTLLWDTANGGDGQEYGWSGTFPKVVPPLSDPNSTGGIAVGAWISRFDPELRVQVREALRRSYAEAGYALVAGSFEVGGTVTTATDVLLYGTEGRAYKWGGVFPGGGKVVPQDSTPASTGGVSPSGWVDVSGTSLRGDLINPNGAAMVGVQGGGTVQSELFAGALESVFSQKVRLGQSDCYVLVQGDSTGDADNEWFRLTANSVAAKYPSHTVKYVPWSAGSNSWGTPVTITTGSGTRTIWFYNGSVPGAVAGYWMGARTPLAFNNISFDVIFTNYGLNVPTSERTQKELHAAHLLFLRQAQPNADIISCIQPVDYAIPARNPLRASAQKLVSGMYGVRIVDVMRRFLDLVASTGGDYAPWYIDSLHPSPAGSIEWAKLTVSALLTSKGDQKCTPSVQVKNSDVPNGMFRTFLSGPSASPDFWVAPNTTVVRDTVFFETFGASVRVQGVGSATGLFRLENADEFMQRWSMYPEVVIAARLRSMGGTSGKCGRLYFAHSTGTSECTEIQSTQAGAESANGEFRWVFLLIDRAFWAGKTNLQLGIFSGEAGESVSIDRILVSPSLLVPDCNSQSYEYTLVVSDSTHSVPANSTTRRVFTATSPVNVRPGMHVSVSMYPAVANVNVSAVCSAEGGIGVFFSNIGGSAASVGAATLRFKFSV